MKSRFLLYNSTDMSYWNDKIINRGNRTGMNKDRGNNGKGRIVFFFCYKFTEAQTQKNLGYVNYIAVNLI